MDPRLALAEKLASLQDQIRQTQVVIGFDGFVDELVKIVDQRQSLDAYAPFKTMTQFADKLHAAAGRSSLSEVVITETAGGGCAVNMGDGLATLGSQLDYFGTAGSPVHAAFEPFQQKCRTFHSWGPDPGRTTALEFDDGKYMLASVIHLVQFDEALLDDVLSDGVYLQSCQAADLIAINNWTLYPHMTDCWRKLQAEVFAKFERRPHIFFDIVDPRSRDAADIKEMFEVMADFEKFGNTIFGCNLNEANVAASLLGLDVVETEQGDIVAAHAQQIREKLGIAQVAIHCVGGAAYADADGAYHCEGPYCAAPKRSTGAGDRYNAGFSLGNVLGLEPEERLLLGSACSGYFVRHGVSGDLPQIIDLLKTWSAGKLD